MYNTQHMMTGHDVLIRPTLLQPREIMYVGAGLSHVFSPIQSLKMDAEGDTERHPDFSYLVSDLPRDMGDSEIAIAVVASHHPLIDDL